MATPGWYCSYFSEMDGGLMLNNYSFLKSAKWTHGWYMDIIGEILAHAPFVYLEYMQGDRQAVHKETFSSREIRLSCVQVSSSSNLIPGFCSHGCYPLDCNVL